MKGGSGNDVLVGGKGADQLWGNSGADRFEFRKIGHSKGANRDEIFGFGDSDRIDLSDIDAREDRSGNNRFKFIDDDDFSGRSGELRYENGKIRADTDGDGGSDFAIEIANDFALTEDHFIL
jgi:Ca2+-binding RTX toxin-like protein